MNFYFNYSNFKTAQVLLYILGFWRKKVIFCENEILGIFSTGPTLWDFHNFKMKTTLEIFKKYFILKTWNYQIYNKMKYTDKILI